MWTKGQSGNPSGRPRGAAGISHYIHTQTDGCNELIDRLLELSRDAKCPLRERLIATQELLSRAVGKPMQPSELIVSTARELPSDWDSKSLAERSAYVDAIMARAS